MSELEMSLSTLDGVLTPSLIGTLAGLALAAAAFIYNLRPGGNTGQGLYLETSGRLLNAFYFFISALVLDAGIFPMIELNSDLDVNEITQGFDTSTQYAVFTGGIFWLVQGARSMGNVLGITYSPLQGQNNPADVETYSLTEIDNRIIDEISEGNGKNFNELLDRIAGPTDDEFKEILSNLERRRYLHRDASSGQEIYQPAMSQVKPRGARRLFRRS